MDRQREKGKMARFCVEVEDHEADERERERPGPSSSSRPNPKRQKLIIRKWSRPPPPSPQQPPQQAVDAPVETEELVEEEEELDSEGAEEESAAEIEAGEEETEYEDEEEEEEDDQAEEESENNLPQESGREGPISVTLTDPDVLDCPICLEPLSIPVFQCENGHITCTSCCLKIHNKCPSCSLPIGYNRCRALEKVLESVRVFCRNSKYGCTQMVKFYRKHVHESICSFAPCSCPLHDCNFVGPCLKLCSHFRLIHPTSGQAFLFDKNFSVTFEKNRRSIILQESKESSIFILNHFSESHGSAVSLVHLAPPGSGVRFSYEFTARDGDTSIKLQSSVERIPKFVECPPAKKFLLVPSYCINACGQLKLYVCIRKDPSLHLGGRN